MRAVTFFGLLILGFAAIVITPAITSGQPGGGFGGKGNKGTKGGGTGGMTFDAGGMFDRLANGRTSIPTSEIRTRNPEALQEFLKERGITNGQLTRQQYVDYTQQAIARFTANPGGGMGGKGTPTTGGGTADGGGGGGKKGGFGGGGNPFSPPGSGGGVITLNPSVQFNPDALNQAADTEFRRRDGNGDGNLNSDEMPQQLRGSVTKWDKNGDTFIDINEFREYFMARILGGDDSQGTRGVASIIIEEEELDRKPVVYRAGGKMPPGMPGWFKEMDIDEDGQIAVWEWRKAGKSLDEFTSWDINDDGLVTPDEAVRQQTSLNKANGISSSGEKPAFGGFGGFGGKGGGKKGGGGFGTPPDGSTGERPAFGGFGKGGGGKGGSKKDKTGGQ